MYQSFSGGILLFGTAWSVLAAESNRQEISKCFISWFVGFYISRGCVIYWQMAQPLM
ncbi:Uncharacterised protein [Segatella copri]|nr:Uncharacterised protein [Segatella copri]